LPVAAQVSDHYLCARGEPSSPGCRSHPGETHEWNRSHLGISPMTRSRRSSDPPLWCGRRNSTMAPRLIRIGAKWPRTLGSGAPLFTIVDDPPCPRTPLCPSETLESDGVGMTMGPSESTPRSAYANTVVVHFAVDGDELSRAQRTLKRSPDDLLTTAFDIYVECEAIADTRRVGPRCADWARKGASSPNRGQKPAGIAFTDSEITVVDLIAARRDQPLGRETATALP
jgi:hypothetical protein